MKHNNLLTEQEQGRLYLIHHMHHYNDGKDIVHELHHCFLFDQEGMHGEKYTVSHLMIGGKLHHILDKNPPKVVFDHADNSFNVDEMELNGKKYYVVR